MSEFPEHINGKNYSNLCTLRKRITTLLEESLFEHFPYSLDSENRYFVKHGCNMDEVDQKTYVKEKEMYLKIKEELENKYFVCDVREIFVLTNSCGYTGYKQLSLVIDIDK